MNALRNLKSFIAERGLTEFSFWSENQEDYSPADPCKLKLSFSTMLVNENPGVICLKEGESTLRLGRVVDVQCDGNCLPVGALITVACADHHTYTIVGI